MTGEFGNTIRYTSLAMFNHEMDSRVYEPEMREGDVYPYMARLLWSRYGDAAEFQAQLIKVAPLENELGRASLELCVFIANPTDPLLVMSGESENGLIIPTHLDSHAPEGQSRRIRHPEAGHIGSIGLGYFRAPSPIGAEQTLHQPLHLIERVSLTETSVA